MVKKKSKIKGRKLSVKTLKKELVKLFARKKSNRYTIKQIGAKLKIENSKDSIQHAVNLLIKEGLVYEIDGRYKYDINASVDAQSKLFPSKEYIGKVDQTRSGDAYIIIDDLEDDVYVPRKFLKSAMNKDTVKVSVPQLKGKRRPEGKVVEIVKRSLTHVIGKVVKQRNYATLIPIDKRIKVDVKIKNDQLEDLQGGEHAVVEITDWGKSQDNAMWGRITAPLQEATDNDMNMQSILLSHGFDLEFPPEVLEQVKHIELDINDDEIARRRDFRDTITFTIDPLTAKDFDDALSYKELENGQIEIGVHIADVTHYVPEDSPLDKEALRRSTSVYLVDRVLPMLPEKLSNNLCSLNPHEDRYTFSAAFTFDEKYNIVDEWFGRGVIHSDRRFTYEEAQEVIETGEGDYVKEVRKMNEIAHKLRKAKLKNGAISFESDEIQFVLDENSVPIDMKVKNRVDAHMLVEDFMLLANKSVAKFMAKKAGNEVPFIYRVHDLPNEEKLVDFSLFAREMGFHMNLKTPKQIAESFNQLAKEAENNELLSLLAPLAIRTMSKAVYTTENIGHYGLAFEFYTHFTSPIRRYSDVLVHRILDKNIRTTHRVDKGKLEAKAKHISMKEKSAAEAERESIKLKQTEYVANHIGEEFEGVISGMIEKGFFVELDHCKAEGLIKFDSLPEIYQIGDTRFKAVSPVTGSEIHMGQRVRVKILDADLDLRQIEMELLEFYRKEDDA